MIQTLNYNSILGHTLNKNNFDFIPNYPVNQRSELMIRIRCLDQNGDSLGFIKPSRHSLNYEIINYDTHSEYGNDTHPGWSKINYNGFSITNSQFVGSSSGQIRAISFDIGLFDIALQQFIPFKYSGQTGAFSLGHYYDLRSPDMSLTMAMEYEGTKVQESTGGKTFRRTQYLGQPKWGKLDPWAIGGKESDNIVSRRGRRSWKLSFRHMQDSDLFPSNMTTGEYYNYREQLKQNILSGITNKSNSDTQTQINVRRNDHGSLYDSDPIMQYIEYDREDFDPERDIWKYLIEDDDSFIARVLNYTANGERFVFQPDYEAVQPSDFYLCTLDQDSLKIKQVSHHVYNISLKIRETW